MADTLLSGIVISEIFVDPNGAQNFDTDGNGTAAATDEYIEIYNASGSAIDISGLELWDAGAGNWFTFPDGTILTAGGHAMVLTGVQSGGSLPTGGADDLFFDAGRGTALINNGGDNVTLFDPSSDEFVQATFNGDTLDDPTSYSGFSATATQVGSGEDFGNDTDGESLQRASDGTDTFTSDTPTPGTTNVCFADGSRIETPTGDIAIEDLKVGDPVMTLDNGAQPVRWLYSCTWRADQVAQCPSLAAVLIQAGALGVGYPTRDLRLSQQHRVLVRGAIAQRMFGTSEVLIPAKAFLAIKGVSLDKSAPSVTYYHVMLGDHEVIFANGIAAESLYLGRQAIETIPCAALAEIGLILDLPVDDLGDATKMSRPARGFVRGRRAAKLIERHAKNSRPII
ncbi:Hint domain-containing protein [Octadecabacter sp. 1_MG-2023]|uniref:Hint domain-containing protein n=1 Tax=unclassified Octadecabacter TaxID=196158 RepID=UPI001C09385A|nr:MULTISPECIES: Hint domain-containing protein [unclassified Octadecabacter]MBU2993069.1 Hint domain-containing protein [Octadecabacter sp. B2R22]MDO6733479.1 Hint domain-containing protein [Octadecabacter sp. 1_MG-2023]